MSRLARRTAPRDRTREIERIIRHALRTDSPDSPVDRAIRSAARSAGLLSEAGPNAGGAVAILARQLNERLSHRLAVAPADPRCETVRS